MSVLICGFSKAITHLKAGLVGVLPTDTLYGLVASAFNPLAVEKIYSLKKRNLQKPCIVLIGAEDEVKKFEVVTEDKTEVFKKYWPGPVSIILPCHSKKFKYLHRNTNTLAFRLPADKDLQDFLLKTGPLIAPSANLEGLPPAKNISEAQKYFGEQVDFYVDGGQREGKPSAVVSVCDGVANFLRKRSN